MKKAFDIKWDTDDMIVDLPKEVLIDEQIDEEDVPDYLSDEYGWCVFSVGVADSAGITYDMMLDGYDQGIVRLTPPEVHDALACEIGDNYFYFTGGGEDEMLSPKAYDVKYGEGAALEAAWSVLAPDESGYNEFFVEFFR